MHIRHTSVAAALIAAGVLSACSSGSSPSPSSSPTGSTGRSSSVVAPGPATDTSSPGTTSATPSTPAPLAHFGKVTGTATTVRFDPTFVKALYTNGLTTTTSGTAKLVPIGKSDDAVLPITGGTATLYGAGRVSSSTARLVHSGSGLTVARAGSSVRVTNLILTLGRTPVITATITPDTDGTVGKAVSTQLFELRPTTSASASAKLSRGTVTMTGMRAYLSTEAARDLRAALGTTAFGASVYVGTVTIVISGS